MTNTNLVRKIFYVFFKGKNYLFSQGNSKYFAFKFYNKGTMRKCVSYWKCMFISY